LPRLKASAQADRPSLHPEELGAIVDPADSERVAASASDLTTGGIARLLEEPPAGASGCPSPARLLAVWKAETGREPDLGSDPRLGFQSHHPLAKMDCLPNPT